jgi:pimeloyl-ACP methyl ester carboxylesterase
MPETSFEQRWSDEGPLLSYWDAGAGETIVAVVDSARQPTPAHALLAGHRRILVFAMADGEASSEQAADRIGAALSGLGVTQFDLIGEGSGAAVASRLALMPGAEIGAVVLAAPAGPIDAAFGKINRPVLFLRGTNDASGNADRYRVLLPGAHFMFVYDAGRAIGIERPEAFAFIVQEFFDRRNLFLVSRESGAAFP